MKAIFSLSIFTNSGTLRLSKDFTPIATTENLQIENKNDRILRRQTSTLSHKESFDIQVNLSIHFSKSFLLSIILKINFQIVQRRYGTSK